MSDINHTVLIGRLTKDAEKKYTTTGKALCAFSIAVNDIYTRDGQKVEDVSFFEVNLWGSLAESLSKYLLKGKQVAITGKLKQDRWKDNNGNARSKIKINCQTVQLLGSREQGSQNSSYNNYKNDQNNNQVSDNFEDEIPF